MKTTVRRRYVIVSGIKKKCRKVDRHFLKMSDVPETFTPEQLEQYRNDALAKIEQEMKTWKRGSFHLDYAEVENRDGFEVVSCMLMDQRNYRGELINGLI